jgi:hypothetical protein
MNVADELLSRERLKDALRNTTDEAACDACLARLGEYVAAQLDGRNVLTLFPQTAGHLDGCLQCAAAYARLYRLEMDAAAGVLPELQRPRRPDLSFLTADPNPLPPLRELLQAGLTRLQNGLRLQLSADLLPRLQPSPMIAAIRAAGDEERYAERLYQLDSGDVLDSDLPIRLTVYRDSESPENCLVEVAVSPAGRSWPQLGGIIVALELPEGRREQQTNNWGVTAFAPVPVDELSELLIEVQL